MAGVIWVIQVVHYPLFGGVGEAGYGAYQAAHMSRITWVVLPAMLVELATGLWLWGRANGYVGAAPFGQTGAMDLAAGVPGSATAWWWLTGALGAIWLSTALLQVPAHAQLARAFDGEAHRRLVDTNWIRTILWSARAAGLLCLAWGGADGRS